MAADHYSMLAPPAVADLAGLLDSCIERELDLARRREPAEAQLVLSSLAPESRG